MIAGKGRYGGRAGGVGTSSSSWAGVPGSSRLTAPALRHEELEQLATVVERLPTGVIVVTPELDVTFSNRAAEHLLHPVEVRHGQPLAEPWPSFSLREYATRLFVLGVATDERVEAGADRVYHVSGITAREKSAVILIDDVTAEELRRRAEREFAANAAHELLTPLTGIVAAAHVLESGAKEVPEDRDQFIGHIARECTRLAKIARALLVLARAQSGEQPPRLDVLHLCSVLDEAVEMAGFNHGAARIQCAEDITVFADPDLLTQAFTNLLENAVRHGTVGTVEVMVNAEARGKVAVVVSNAGIASSHDLGERRRFQTPDGPDAQGFGLGISIARQSFEVLGGALTYDTDGETLHARVLLPAGRIE
jgi:signal transduction histidine kinase